MSRLDEKIGTWIDKQRCIRGFIKLYKHYDEVFSSYVSVESSYQAMHIKWVIAYILCHDFKLYDAYRYCLNDVKRDIVWDYTQHQYEAKELIGKIQRQKGVSYTDKRNKKYDVYSQNDTNVVLIGTELPDEIRPKGTKCIINRGYNNYLYVSNGKEWFCIGTCL